MMVRRFLPALEPEDRDQVSYRPTDRVVGIFPRERTVRAKFEPIGEKSHFVSVAVIAPCGDLHAVKR